MYPRNATTPEPIAIGPVIQISDGAVQTSGVTVRIKPIGVSEGDGAGTTAYSTDGVVLYSPTQAETNYTSFVLVAKKTGCVPIAVTVVTIASSVTGKPPATLAAGDVSGNLPANVLQFGSSNGTFSSGRPEVNVTHAAGTAWNSGAIGASTFAVDSLTASALATDAVQEIRNAITGGAYALDTDASGRIRIVDGTGTGEIDTSSGKVSIVAGDITSIQSGLATSAEIAALNDLDSTDVQSAAEAALQTYHLDHFIASADPGGVAADSSFLAKITSKSATPSFASYSNTTDSLEAIRDRGDAAWTGGGGGGVTAAEIWEYVDRTLTAIDEDTTTLDLDATIRAAVGLASANLDTQLSAIDDYIDTEITTILDRIGVPASSLAADIAALNDASAADVWSSGTRTLTAGTNIVLAKGVGVTGFNDLSTAQVNAEVVDALATDTYAEPGQGAPPATASLTTKLNWLYTSWRNKKDNDGSTTNLYAADGSTILAKQATTAADGVVEKAVWITGA